LVLMTWERVMEYLRGCQKWSTSTCLSSIYAGSRVRC
jgi:hypothetical protein